MDIKNLPIPPWGALYEPDERDYDWDMLWITIWDLPDVIINNDEIIQDQDEAGYPYWCVHFGSSMSDNHANWQDNNPVRSTWAELADKSPTFHPQVWDYISAWPKALKQLWHIEGYFTVKGLENILLKLSEGHVLFTWSNTINWKQTYINYFTVVIWSSYGHAFQIIGYNNSNKPVQVADFPIKAPPQTLICKNSYKRTPYFFIKFEDIDRAMYVSKYFFENDKDPILKYKKDIMKNLNMKSAKLAFLLNLWNGKDPSKSITREESATMLWRMIEKLMNWEITPQKIKDIEKELKDLEK